MSNSFYPVNIKDGKLYCRFTVDDNIRFLEDLTLNKSYTSVFDNEYLAMYRRLHEKYGLKVTFNLFYSYFESSFSLDNVTDRFKDEWKKNSDWLRFSFHARHNDPEFPYENADAKTLLKDFDDVTDNIIRFAGKECVSDFITIHYLIAPNEAAFALKERGVRGFMGISAERNGRKTFAASLSEDKIAVSAQNSVCFDSESELYFITNDIVLNTVSLEEIVPLLQKAEQKQTRFIDLMIHEQYFYSDYINYQADFEKKLDCAFNWLYKRGYGFAFADDCLF